MGWTHLSDKTVKGRKDYRCFLCGQSIEKGCSHVVRKGVRDGEIDTFRMHSECERETDDWDEMGWESFEEGNLRRPDQSPATGEIVSD